MEAESHTILLLFFLSISSLHRQTCFCSATSKRSAGKKMKEVVGNHEQSMLPYTLFFTEKEMKDHSYEETLFSRAEILPQEYIDLPKRSRAEYTLSNAINQLRNGKHVWKITLIALMLEKLIAPEPPVARLPWWKGPERIYVSSLIKMFDGSGKREKLQADIKSLMRDADEQHRQLAGNSPEQQTKRKHNKRKQRRDMLQHPPLWIPLLTPEDVFKTWYSQGTAYRYRKMKRSTVLSENCINGGSAVDSRLQTSSQLIRLCDVCVKDIDLGPNVKPRYAKSVECNGGEPSCLAGDGECVQKVIYTTFQRWTDGVKKNGNSGEWNSFQLPLNTTCECQCHKGSPTDIYFT